VPNAALSYGGGSSLVVLRDGATQRVAVETGTSDGTTTVILSGVQPGDQVVTGNAAASASSSTSRTTSILSGATAGGPPPAAGR
jgi:multidrug efflux system membrane fusion protein